MLDLLLGVMLTCSQAVKDMGWLLGGDVATHCVYREEIPSGYLPLVDERSVAGFFASDGGIWLVADPSYDAPLFRGVAAHEFGHFVDWAGGGGGPGFSSRPEEYANQYSWIYSDWEARGHRLTAPRELPGSEEVFSRLMSGFYGEVKMHRDIRRVYLAAFGREPEVEGMAFWMSRRATGDTLQVIASFFAGSPEFVERYGFTDDGEFVERIYRNVMMRASDPGGRDYWVGRLRSGSLSRGGLLAMFADSPEFRERVG